MTLGIGAKNGGVKAVISCGVTKMLKAQAASLASFIGLLAACLISGRVTRPYPMLGDVGFTLGDEPQAWDEAAEHRPSKARRC